MNLAFYQKFYRLRVVNATKTCQKFVRSRHDRGTKTFGSLERKNSIKALQHQNREGILGLE